MPLSLQFVKPYNLDLSTGILTDPDGNLVPNSNDSTPATIGMDTNLFKDQVGELAKKKTPIEKVFKGIDLHPEVTNKVEAKRIAEEHYKSFQDNPFMGVKTTTTKKENEIDKNQGILQEELAGNFRIQKPKTSFWEDIGSKLDTIVSNTPVIDKIWDSYKKE